MSVVNHKYQYIFCHEPHTGGRAIEKALMSHEGSQNFNGEHHIPVIKMIDREWVTEEQFDTYFKFRVIRNPYDWLVTCWVHTDPHQKQEFNTWVMTKGLGFTATSTLFCRYDREVDMNVRFENLEQNLHFAFLSYDIPPVTLEKVGVTQDKPHWSDLLTVNQAKQLEKFYPDINGFGYSLFGYRF